MKQTRIEIDWMGFVLVGLMITFVFWAIIAADWAEGLTVVWLIALGGLASGLALSVSRFPPWLAQIFSDVYGIGWGLYWVGRLVEQGETWRERILEIDRRVGVWLWQVTHNEVSRDALIFVILLSALAWVLAYYAVWYSQRSNRVWWVVLPSGLLIFANVYYAGSLTLYLLAYMLTALLIIVRLYSLNQEHDWRQSFIRYTTDFRFDLLRAGFTLAVVAILIGWGVPAAAGNERVAQIWRRIEGPWRSVEDTWNRIFSSLRSRQPVYADPFGRFLTLQGARFVTDAPVMDVTATESSYWRAAAFNQYTGSGWMATNTRAIPLEAYEKAYRYEGALRHPVTQTMTLYRPATSMIFAAPQPLQVSVPVRADAWSPSDLVLDPVRLSADTAFAQGSGYVVISWVSSADEGILQRAGEDYPAWVTELFLGLPDTLPQRVRDLAEEITAPYDNPYDKATALERWMRANIVYDDKIDAPPPDRDVVDYLLFESRRGYCDYYASGMAVMARAVGIPARVVAGYVEGTYDPVSRAYRVKDKDSHSWVEVYFPRMGWIQFEPTSSRSVLARPTPEPSVTPTDESGTRTPGGTPPPRPDRDFEDPEDRFDRGMTRGLSQRVSFWLVGGVFAFGALLLAAAVVLARAGFDSWSLNPIEVALLIVSSPRAKDRLSFQGLTPVQRAYARLMRLAGWLRLTLNAHHTPHERGELFCQSVPQGRQAISTIVDNYVREQYGRGTIAGEDSRQAWELVRAWIWKVGLRQRQELARAFISERWAAFQNWDSRFG